LNLAMPSLILIPFGRGVERMKVLKHSAPHSSWLLSLKVSRSPSPSKRCASHRARVDSTLC
jgi:hypothetical protein